MAFWAYVQSNDFLAMSAHCGWGGFIVLGFGLWLRWFQAVGVLVVFAVIKELFVDYFRWGEGHLTPDWLDLALYLVGGGIATGLLLIKERYNNELQVLQQRQMQVRPEMRLR
jgi:hypothetical protein